MSGGLGPTSDDITKKTLAEIFGGKMVMHAPTLELLRGYFERRGKGISQRNEEQALVPDNCEVLMNRRGTAPGMLFRKDGKILVSMAGVPFEMLYLLEHEVIPRIRESFEKRYFQNHIFRLIGIFESSLADKISDIEESFPACLDISYLPRIDGIWLELTVRGEESEAENLKEVLQKNVALIRERIADFLYTEGQMSLEEEILQLCKAKSVTLAVAESITGGTITSKLVKISGASTYLKGGITTYFTETKTQILGVASEVIEKEGVVSAEVAMKMAEGVKQLFQSDFAIATTGYAESPAKGEFGSVWIGFAGQNGQLLAHRETLPFDRQHNIERAACLAMIFLLRNLKMSVL
jgi:nicotinamide-nucleotide amidase